VVDRADAFMLHLAEIMGWPQAPRFPHRHKSRISREQRERMRAQLEDLRHHPMLSSLFEAERAVYLHACAIGQKSPRRSARSEPARSNEQLAIGPQSP